MEVMSRKSLLIALAMMLTFWCGFFLKPTKHAVSGAVINLEVAVPTEFAGWKVDNTIVPVQVSPDTLAALKSIYNQTLSRTYVNQNGQRVMLSIAYGGEQSDSMQVHKPEVCYTAQGFQVTNARITTLNTGYGVIPVKKLLATMNGRVEPITYWITIGNTVEVNSIKWKLQQLKYGLMGSIPDGMLFRISSIGIEGTQYQVQQDFVKELLKSISPEFRQRLVGRQTL
jgi:EpsI family protein